MSHSDEFVKNAVDPKPAPSGSAWWADCDREEFNRRLAARRAAHKRETSTQEGGVSSGRVAQWSPL